MFLAEKKIFFDKNDQNNSDGHYNYGGVCDFKK